MLNLIEETEQARLRSMTPYERYRIEEILDVVDCFGSPWQKDLIITRDDLKNPEIYQTLMAYADRIPVTRFAI